MTKITFHRVDETDGDDNTTAGYQFDSENQEVLLGRGPLLQINSTSISRKHASLKMEGAKLMLTCKHNSAVFVRRKGTCDSSEELEELKKDDTTEIRSGDTILFTMSAFHFRLEKDELLTSSRPSCKTEESVVVEEALNEHKRKLPAWMDNKENDGPQTASGTKPRKTQKVDRKTPPKKDRDRKEIEDEPLGLSDLADANLEQAKEGVTPPRSRQADSGKANEDGGHDCPSDATADVPTVEGIPLAQGATNAEARTVNDAQNSVQPSPPTNDQSNSAPSLATARPSCEYGATCYRKNPIHRRDMAHPGDADYAEPRESSDAEDDDRPECEYGINCYRRNPEHKREYKHTRVPQPRRRAKAKKPKKKDDDEYESDFIDDDSEEFDPVDDSDEDAHWEPSQSQGSDD